MFRKHTFRGVVAVLVMVLMVSAVFPVYAAGSLDEALKNKQQQTQQQETPAPQTVQNPQPTQPEKRHVDNVDETTKGFVKNLMDITKPAPVSEGVSEWVKQLSRLAGTIVVILSYVFIAWRTVEGALDVLYLGVAQSRTFLANGYYGNAQAGAGGVANSEVGGFGSGFGGGFGSGFGGYGNRQTQNITSGPSQQPASGRIQLVSDLALNLVAAQKTVGPDGKQKSLVGTYFRMKTTETIGLTVWLVLNISGIVYKVGFTLAVWGIGWIESLALKNGWWF